ncbi:MAG TPA: YggS family pyridoxal phosphate-dependent enzyme [Terriglobia bacterium]|nr:YggS family pyridoxal phosphate-dependent enzyme [Terriglobia bacterium]
MNAETEIAGNLRRIQERVAAAALRSGRNAADIRLMAVTKTVPAVRIREAIACGVREIGENRLQEALSKREELAGAPLTWHFIGRIQTNKARKIAENFDWVHSVDRADVAKKLDVDSGRRLPVLIEANLSGESSKGGVAETGLVELAGIVRECRHLDLRGLMTVPPYSDDPESTRPYFRRLRELAEQLQLRELSMGMSHDFEIAIEEGATIIRIGTALFGARS